MAVPRGVLTISSHRLSPCSSSKHLGTVEGMLVDAIGPGRDWLGPIDDGATGAWQSDQNGPPRYGIRALAEFSSLWSGAEHKRGLESRVWIKTETQLELQGRVSF